MEMYDTIIIGAGVTGLATAMYTGRLNLKALVLGTTSGNELPIGGVITLTDTVDNYPGFIHLTGEELAKKLEEHAKDYDIPIKEEKAVDVSKNKKMNCFIVKTEESAYYTKTVIFATGAKWRELLMKGADAFKNRGVHYCALCDGALYRDKILAVVGGSDTAAKEALLLAQHGKKVYIIYRGDNIRPEPVNGKLIEKNKKIGVITNTNVVEIERRVRAPDVAGAVEDRVVRRHERPAVDRVAEHRDLARDRIQTLERARRRGAGAGGG